MANFKLGRESVTLLILTVSSGKILFCFVLLRLLRFVLFLFFVFCFLFFMVVVVFFFMILRLCLRVGSNVL